MEYLDWLTRSDVLDISYQTVIIEFRYKSVLIAGSCEICWRSYLLISIPNDDEDNDDFRGDWKWTTISLVVLSWVSCDWRRCFSVAGREREPGARWYLQDWTSRSVKCSILWQQYPDNLQPGADNQTRENMIIRQSSKQDSVIKPGCSNCNPVDVLTIHQQITPSKHLQCTNLHTRQRKYLSQKLLRLGEGSEFNAWYPRLLSLIWN